MIRYGGIRRSGGVPGLESTDVSESDETPWSLGSLPHVLYVGDESERRDDVLANLGEGWGVQAARDGIHAMELLNHPARPPDAAIVIVLDLSMPVLEGIGFEQARRADPALAHHPVILVTPHASDPRVRKVGVSHYEPRPVDPGALAEAIRRLAPGT